MSLRLWKIWRLLNVHCLETSSSLKVETFVCCYIGLTIQSIDNPIAQNLLIKQLERFNLNVTAANNGEEALAGPSDLL